MDAKIIKRAVLMLRIAGQHSETYGSEEESHYDGTDCDGYCINEDCKIAADDLEDMLNSVQRSVRS